MARIWIDVYTKMLSLLTSLFGVHSAILRQEPVMGSCLRQKCPKPGERDDYSWLVSII